MITNIIMEIIIVMIINIIIINIIIINFLLFRTSPYLRALEAAERRPAANEEVRRCIYTVNILLLNI